MLWRIIIVMFIAVALLGLGGLVSYGIVILRRSRTMMWPPRELEALSAIGTYVVSLAAVAGVALVGVVIIELANRPISGEVYKEEGELTFYSDPYHRIYDERLYIFADDYAAFSTFDETGKATSVVANPGTYEIEVAEDRDIKPYVEIYNVRMHRRLTGADAGTAVHFIFHIGESGGNIFYSDMTLEMYLKALKST